MPDAPPIGDRREEKELRGTSRTIRLVDDATKKLFAPNEIRSTKFSIRPWRLDFVVYKGLYEQFQRKANFFFVFVSILQVIPGVSPTGTYTTLGTLITVLVISIFRSVFEDARRYFDDRAQNQRLATVLDKETSTWKTLPIIDLQPGHIIRIASSDEGDVLVPCDCIVLTSSDPDGNAYVETSSVDGETNLKIRNAVAQIPKPRSLTAEQCCERYSTATVDAEPSTSDMNSFEAIYRDQLHDEVHCGLDNAVFRGSTIKKTLWFIAVAVYTGGDCKAMRNRNNKTMVSKQSAVERKLNRLLLIVLVLLLTLCIICVVVNIGVRDTPWYNPGRENTDLETFLSFLTFIVLFNNFIPISLYVSLEIIKFIQGLFMSADLCMYSESADKRCAVRNSEIIEDLGQITHLLCDKTGTLTRNVMCFKKMCVNGTIYGHANSQMDAMRTTQQKAGAFEAQLSDNDPSFDFVDRRMGNSLDYTALPDSHEIRELLVAMAINHGVVPIGDKYEAEYPDEASLVHAAKRLGVRFVNQRRQTITLELGTAGIYMHYDVLCVIPFTPKRKRMTVVVREHVNKSFSNKFEPNDDVENISDSDVDGAVEWTGFDEIAPATSSVFVQDDMAGDNVLVITKGADSVMVPRYEKSAAMLDITASQGERLASQGLRVMHYGSKRVPLDEFQEWFFKYESCKDQNHRMGRRYSTGSAHSLLDAQASASVYNVETMDPLVELEDELESNLRIVGVTGLEDKLQNNVAQTIANVRAAGVKVWVATGDHQSTARRISTLCGVLQMEDQSVVLSEENIQNRESLVAALSQSPTGVYTVEVDGATLQRITPEQELLEMLYVLLKGSSAVVFSRASPRQKLKIASLIRKHDENARVLGIGDGANDVPMIEACNVGVGMFGREGHQAVNASDFAIAEFAFLHRLLLVHGRANYVRLCKVICYFFYKNALLVSTQFWFGIYNQFSGESLYEGLTFALYNVLFTSLPCIVLGVADRDILSSDNLFLYPEVYKRGIRGDCLTAFLFVRWMVEGLAHSLCAFFVVILALSPSGGGGLRSDGKVSGEATVGLIVYSTVIVITTLRIAFEMRSWTTLHAFSLVLSLAFGWVFYFAYGELEDHAGSMYKLSLDIGFRVQTWATGAVATAFAILPTISVMYIVMRLLPPKYQGMIWHIALEDSTDPDASTREPAELRLGTASHFGESHHSGFGDPASETNTFKALVGSSRSTKQRTQGLVVRGMFSSFDDPAAEEKFLAQLVGDLHRYRRGALLAFVSAGIVFIANFFLDVTDNERVAYGVLCFLGLVSLVIFSVRPPAIRTYYHSVLLVLTLGGFACACIANLIASRSEPDTHPVTIAILMLGLITVVRPPLFHAAQYMSIAVVSYALWYQAFSVLEWGVRDMTLRTLEIIVVGGIALLRLAVREYFLRAVFAADEAAQSALSRIAEEEERSFLLLGSVLPVAIVNDVKQNKRGLSQYNCRFGQGSYLQSDIVMFTKFSSGHEPTVVIEMLNRMFTKFDSLSAMYNVEKIKTIGDAYICCSGVPVEDPLHAQRIIMVALGLSDKMSEMNSEGLSTLRTLDLHVRVGVASGSLMGGVVGKQKVAYDVFGEAKDRADILEQTGKADRVQCTKEMAETLQDDFSFEMIPDDDGNEHYFVVELVNTSLFMEPEEDPALVLGRPIPVVEGENHEEVYRFLDDSDMQRVEFIASWQDFDGESNPMTLKFNSEEAESEFIEEVSFLAGSRSMHDMLLGAAFFILAAIICILAFTGEEDNPYVLLLFGFGIVHVIAAAVVEFLSTHDHTNDHSMSFWKRTRRFGKSIAASFVGRDSQTTLVVLSMVSGLTTLGSSVALGAVFDNEQVTTITVFVTIAAAAHGTGFLFFRVVPKLGALCVHFIAVMIVIALRERNRWDTGTTGGDVFAICIAYLFVIMDIYDFERQVRHNYVSSRLLMVRELGIESAVALSDRLLNNVLPNVVINKLRNDPDRQVVDEYQSASVMFIYNNAMDIDPDADADLSITQMNKLVFMIDTICKDCGAEKIKTSPYLLVCGLPEPNAQHGMTLVTCALKILDAVDRINAEHPDEEKVLVKIGVNSGKISAGVLGKTKFQYDVFGDTVNLASRLTNNGDWGSLTISTTTREEIAGCGSSIAIIDKGDKYLKGKGNIRILEVDRKASQLPSENPGDAPIVSFDPIHTAMLPGTHVKSGVFEGKEDSTNVDEKHQDADGNGVVSDEVQEFPQE